MERHKYIVVIAILLLPLLVAVTFELLLIYPGGHLLVWDVEVPSFVVSPDAWCDNNGTFRVVVVNTGYVTIKPSDWYHANVTNSTANIPLNIKDVHVKQAVEFNSSSRQGVSGAKYNLTLATVTIEVFNVSCP